jgi:hypothetical protein
MHTLQLLLFVVSMNKLVFSVRYTPTLETEQVRDFVTCIRYGSVKSYRSRHTHLLETMPAVSKLYKSNLSTVLQLEMILNTIEPRPFNP